jgi:carboxyl-terminal processing protease
MNTILNFMKRNYKILLAIVLVSTLFAFKLKSEILILIKINYFRIINFVLEKGHYSPATIDDTF